MQASSSVGLAVGSPVGLLLFYLIFAGGRMRATPMLSRNRTMAEEIEHKASFSSQNRGEKHCIRIPVVFRLYLVKIIQILTN
jgi:hypothetical protein